MKFNMKKEVSLPHSVLHSWLSDKIIIGKIKTSLSYFYVIGMYSTVDGETNEIEDFDMQLEELSVRPLALIT
jgi:hypothetical protein